MVLEWLTSLSGVVVASDWHRNSLQEIRAKLDQSFRNPYPCLELWYIQNNWWSVGWPIDIDEHMKHRSHYLWTNGNRNSKSDLWYQLWWQNNRDRGRFCKIFIQMKIKILIWNIQGLNDKNKRSTLASLVMKWKADILCLQETKMASKYCVSDMGE